MKIEKRSKLQDFLRSATDKLLRDDNEVLELSTDTLQRISHFYNKDSKVFVNDQTAMLKREDERKKMMQ
jgi:DnaJ family protein C protein 17